MTFSMKRAFSGVVLALVFGSCVLADVEEVHYYIRVGDSAPVLSATDDQDKKWSSTPFLGKKILVLFFYEGDFMKNCTKEAREMQSLLSELRTDRAEVIGVSGDTAANHRRFKKANKLSFTLLADSDGKVAHRLGVSRSGGGVLRVKDERGHEIEVERGMTAGRWTFIIDLHGKVAYKKMDASPAGHAREVLAIVRKLNAGP
jgi:peroxiredoxin Q/BCP